MPIFRVFKDKDHPYTIINNTSLNDKRLSSKAKGILAFLISKPNNWFVNLDNLVSSFNDGIHSIRTGIHELISFGYIIRTQTRKENGRFGFYDYAVFEQPIKPTLKKTMSLPKCDFPISDKPISDNRTLPITHKKDYTDKTSTTRAIFNSSCKPFVDVSFINPQKKEVIKLLKELKIFNYKKLFELFSLIDIFKYTTWIKDNNFKMKNPTGFLITAIKEKWITFVPEDSSSGLRVFFCECSICHKSFGYEDYIESPRDCLNCLNKG